MIDVSNYVYEKLLETDTEVCRSFPKAFKDFPLISFYELENGDSGYCEREVISDISYQIDVWSKTQKELSELSLQVDEKMAEIGFRRDFAQILSEDNVFRRTMRYSAKVNTRNLRVYKK